MLRKIRTKISNRNPNIDIGLGINLGKCAASHIKRGKYYKDADLPVGDDQIIKVLEKDGRWKMEVKVSNT